MKCKEESACCSLMNTKDELKDEDYVQVLITRSDISVKEDPENEYKKVSSQEPIMKCKEESACCSLMNTKDELKDEDYVQVLITQSDISIKEDPENEYKKVPSQEPVMNCKEQSSCCSLMKIKDEPTDEDYDKVLITQSDISIKEDPENEDKKVLRQQLNIANRTTMASKRYTAEEALALYDPLDVCVSDGEELPSDVETDSDMELRLSTSEDGTSDEEQPSPPRKRRCEANTPAPAIKSKDGTLWEKVDALHGSECRTTSTFREKAGPTEYAKRKITSRLQSFLCLINMEMLLTITECTVREARRTQESWSLCVSELMAFIAVLFLRAAHSCQNGAMVDCWSEYYADPAIKETMPRNRYQDIMRYLRFDNKDTRAERAKTDSFAAISDIWQSFVSNCQLCYVPGQHITVDEQLFPTKVRCPFTQYISNKPDKFGMKFWIAADLETKYICNAMPYLGKDPSRPKGERLSEAIVMRLTEPFLGQSRTVTMDNFFTSLALANRLLDCNTTMLGTLNPIRREVPPPAKTAKGKAEFSTEVYRSGGATLTVYTPKKNKTICVLSTMHQQVCIGAGSKKKPDTVMDYNHMKCGVDIMDQKVRAYTVRAGTRRWPVAVFYNILDLAAMNAHVLYSACTSSRERRRDFLHCLGMELRQRFVLEKAMKKQQRPPLAPGKKTRCQVQMNCNRNHSTTKCAQCDKYTCRKCRNEQPWLCGKCGQFIIFTE